MQNTFVFRTAEHSFGNCLMAVSCVRQGKGEEGFTKGGVPMIILNCF